MRQNGEEAKISWEKTSQKSWLYVMGSGQQPTWGQSNEEILHPEKGRLYKVSLDDACAAHEVDVLIGAVDSLLNTGVIAHMDQNKISPIFCSVVARMCNILLIQPVQCINIHNCSWCID